MATITVTSSLNIDSLTWASGDQLDINNGAVVTVNTDQTKWWRTVNINIGELRIENNSTGSGIRFLMGRNLISSTRSVLNVGNVAKFFVSGSLINIGEGSGSANQTFTSWTTEYLPFMLVEKSPGSATASKVEDRFDIWMNATYRSGSLIQGPYQDHISACAGDDRGWLFTQGTTDHFTYTTASMAKDYFTSTLTVGNGTNGAVVPVGCKVFLPNIMLADDTIGLYLDRFDTSIIEATNGGIVDLRNCMLSTQIFLSLNQFEKLNLENFGTSHKFNVLRCKDVTIKNVGMGFLPISYYVPLPGRPTRLDARWSRGTYSTFNYVNGAIIRNMRVLNANSTYDYTSSVYGIFFEYCKNLDIDGFRVDHIYMMFANSQEVTFQTIQDSTFKNLKFYGVGVYFNYCTNILVDGYKVAHSLGKYCKYSAFALNTIPNSTFTYFPDGSTWQIGTPYYFKVRSWRDLNLHLCSETPRSSQITPYLPVSSSFPMRWSAYGTATNTITVGWVDNNGANANLTAYRVYSGSTDSFTPNDATNRIYNATGTSVTASVAENTRCYFILRKVYANGTFEDTPPFSAVTALNFDLRNYLLQSNALDTANWTKTGCTITANQTYPYSPVEWQQNGIADLVSATADNASVSQAVGSLNTGHVYTFSSFLADPMMLTASAEIKIQSGPTVAASASYILSNDWTLATASLTIPAGQNSITCSLTIANSGSLMHVIGSNLDSSSIARTAINTTTAAVTNGIIITPQIGWDWVNRAVYSLYSGTNSTINTSHMLHAATGSANFVPTLDNCIAQHTTLGVAYRFDRVNNSIIKNMEHHEGDLGYGGVNTQFGIACLQPFACNNTKFLNLESNNRFKDTDRYLNFNSCTDIVCSNFSLGEMRRYVAPSNAANQGTSVLAENTNEGIYIQNIRFSASLYEKGYHRFNARNSYIRNVQGGLDIDRGTTANIGNGNGAGTGIGTSYTNQYDTNWFEMQTGTGSGLLALRFNATQKPVRDFIQFSGSFEPNPFSGLYVWDYYGSASFKLPYKCRNITGFPAIEPKYFHTFTTDTTAAFRTVKPNCLSFSYKINDGAWKSLNTSSLSSETITGPFDFEIKVEPNGFWLEFDGRSTTFVLGETLNGASFGATGILEEVVFFSGSTTAGQIKLGANTGSWRDNEAIRSGVTTRASVNMGNNIIGGYPRHNAFVQALDIYTYYDSSSMYPDPFIGLNTTSGKAFIF